MSLDPHDIVTICLDVRYRKFRGVIFAARGEHALELAESAAYILHCVDGKRSVQGIGELLACHYEIAVADAIADTKDLLEELQEACIIEQRVCD
ncbi:PqqD family protein [Streptomyces sp. NPDC059552]|uniref:PqqD family protein n=1 Tax=Streptomyces sp. NPDC059552 TaxID=3346862 RepID=UPI0036C5BF42